MGVLWDSREGIAIFTGSFETLKSKRQMDPLSQPARTFSEEKGEKIAVSIFEWHLSSNSGLEVNSLFQSKKESYPTKPLLP